jgi:hypothetical protein
MSGTNNKIDILWLRASIMGGIWASSEIIIGSFLHNLRIPFSGMILSTIAVFLLTAFDKQWRQNGIIWRAGLIAALMKSLSPSAVIFGPMIGIFCEAVLFQIAVMLFGRNILSYSIGGALAVSWSFVQMVIGMIIVYGSNLVVLYSNVYKSVLKILSISNADPALLIFLLLGIYVVFGIAAAICGLLVKKNVSSELYDFTKEEKYIPGNKSTVFNKHSFAFLFIVLAAMIIGIGWINTLSFPISIFYLTTFVFICYKRYGSLLKRIINIKFWLEITLIAMLSSFFLSKFQGNVFFSFSGLYAGYLMVYRAILLSVSFNILSIELTSPKLKTFLVNKKMSNVSEALETSFKTLPILISLLAANKKKSNRPLVLVAEYINAADRWIDFKLQNKITLQQ